MQGSVLLSLFALSFLVLGGCDRRQVERVHFPDAEILASFPDKFEAALPEVPEHVLYGESSFLPTAGAAQLRFSWPDPLGTFPFAIYRISPNGRALNRIRTVPRDSGPVEIRSEYDGFEQVLYCAVGKTEAGEWWRGPFVSLSMPKDFSPVASLAIPDRVEWGRIFLSSRFPLYLQKSPDGKFFLKTPEIFSDGGTIDNLEPKPDPAAPGKSPRFISLEVGSLHGRLTIYARGENRGGERDPAGAAAPGVFVRLDEGSDRPQIEQIPAPGGIACPVCVRIGKNAVQGCGEDWQLFMKYFDESDPTVEQPFFGLPRLFPPPVSPEKIPVPQLGDQGLPRPVPPCLGDQS